ncbi:MAG TPA: hypothetical protein VD862_03950 [Candidatus Paceibacterota bacterium]|nr:hypothetical protein [Candidatus Paceibacterota bacterium]
MPLPKPELVLHHDDSPCSARLNSGFCPECGYVPDMQSTCFYFYCTSCHVPLDKLTCPQCGQAYEYKRS